MTEIVLILYLLVLIPIRKLLLNYFLIEKMSFAVEVTSAYREASNVIIELIVAMPATKNLVLCKLNVS